MRKVLIVSPHFPPVNAPDHQRVRMSLPYLREFGWEPHVLAVKPEDAEGSSPEPRLEKTYPSNIGIDRVSAVPSKLTRLFGMGGLGFRSFSALQKEGDRLLQTGSFDLVYFSTTVFISTMLGPRWKKRFGIPYVIDFQDPWLSDYYSKPGSPLPPGGRLKYAFSQWVAKRNEPTVVRNANSIISVSPKYPEMLRTRYPEVPAKRFTVLPFGAPENDFETAIDEIPQSIFDPADGHQHWAYVGRGGGDMSTALHILFSALAQLRSEGNPLVENLRLHFVGTSYARAGKAQESIAPLARNLGVADLVQEITARIPYFQALRVLKESDVILLIGSNDSAYTASKVFPCILARRPLLGIFHEESSVISIVRKCRAGEVIAFHPEKDIHPAIEEAKKQVIMHLTQPPNVRPNTDWEAFSPYTAREMTRRQCEVFGQAVTDGCA